jgi:hypothetical protein
MSFRATTRASLVAVGVTLAAAACTSFSPPDPFDEASLRERAVTEERDGIRASAALLLLEEIEAIFGFDLTKKGVQPVWLEIENRTDRPVYFLLTGLDPEYFPPLEVGYAFRSMFSGEANDRLDAHLSALAFDHRALLAPGTSRSGFVYTLKEDATKVVNVDVLGEKWTTSLTLFAVDPTDRAADERRADIERRFSEPELVYIEDGARLQEAIEALPCCAEDSHGRHVAPLNVVIVGELRHWVSAAQRRGYRYRSVSALRAFLRPQDASGVKGAHWVEAQSQALRLWQTPLRYRSLPVWLAQVSMPRGGRFAEETRSIDPAVDDARNALVEDLLYSQQVARIGFARGAGCSHCRESGVSTDGVRTVLVFSDRAISLDEIDFFDWERIAGYR